MIKHLKTNLHYYFQVKNNNDVLGCYNNFSNVVLWIRQPTDLLVQLLKAGLVDKGEQEQNTVHLLCASLQCGIQNKIQSTFSVQVCNVGYKTKYSLPSLCMPAM